MRVTRLSLRDFRNYTEADVELEPGVTLVLGSNGQGKTNLVEALGYLATLRSHRVADDTALIRYGADSAIVRAHLAHADRRTVVELQLNRHGGNRVQLGGAALRPRDLPRHVATAQFVPEDLSLVRGEPAVRRRFLDELAVQLHPRLAAVISDYDRVLRQRNTLLKSARRIHNTTTALSTLDVWDERLVDFGTELVMARIELVRLLGQPVCDAYGAIAGQAHRVHLGSRLSIVGGDTDDDAAQPTTRDSRPPESHEAAHAVFRQALQTHRRAELERGLTLVGPHRDDLILTLNELPARGYASQGESWSLALALRLASARVLRSGSPLGDPVLVLDDVFAELDEPRRRRLAEAVVDFEQILVTAAVEADVPAALNGRRLHVHGGIVQDRG